MTSALGLTALILATQLAAGWLVWVRLASGGRDVDAPTLARAALLGPAAIAVQMLAYGLIGIPFALWTVLPPWWLCAGIELRRGEPRVRLLPVGGWQAAAAVLVAAKVAVILVVGSSVPVYASDAMNNYALPARVFAEHGGLVPSVLAGLAEPGNVHYPPLLAFNEALFFLADGELGATLLQPMFALGFLAWALLVAEALRDRRRPLLSLLCVTLVLATPEPTANAVHSLPDVRLMAALLMMVLEARRLVGDHGRVAPFALAAIAAGLTKREGYVLAAGACAYLLACAWSRRRRGDPVHRATVLGIVAIAAVVGTWPAYASMTGIPPEFRVDTQAGVFLSALGEVPAVLSGLVAGAFASDIDGIARWGIIWPVAATLGVWRAVAGRDRDAMKVLALWAAHLAILAYAVAVVQVGFAVRTDFVLGSTEERILLQQLPWVVLLLPTAARHGALQVDDRAVPAYT